MQNNPYDPSSYISNPNYQYPSQNYGTVDPNMYASNQPNLYAQGSSGNLQYPPPQQPNPYASNMPGAYYPPQQYPPQNSLHNSQGYPSQPYSPQPSLHNSQGYAPNSPNVSNSPNPYFGSAPQEQQIHQGETLAVPYRIYWNTIAGIGAGLMERGDKALNSGFPVYEVTLNYIDSVFGSKRQKWNDKYDNAIKIYGPGIQSKLVRGTIKVQHTALYSSSLQNTKGSITSGQDLLERVLHYGWREGRYYFYTYVIVDGKWRFTETGVSTLKDMISKHAMHANCAREVIYAGEFHVQRTPDGNNYKLIIDNNSGTFAPSLDDLPLLEQLFRRNFPGLIVEAYDRNSPVLKNYVETIKAYNNNLIAQGGR